MDGAHDTFVRLIHGGKLGAALRFPPINFTKASLAVSRREPLRGAGDSRCPRPCASGIAG
jgi:hypothetical protein